MVKELKLNDGWTRSVSQIIEGSLLIDHEIECDDWNF